MTFTDSINRLIGDAKALDEIWGLSSSLPHAGLALVVVDAEGAQLVFTHGSVDMRSRIRVDADTMFNIGSCSKAFAATLLQVLAAEDAIDLQAPIQRYAPGFAVLDPWISAHATVHDALVHRVGVASMFFLRMVAASRTDFVARFRHAPETSGFRNRFQYNNSLYIVLAHLTEELTHCSWAAALRERILEPLGMRRTSADAPLHQQNVALPHVLGESGDSLRPISLEYHNAMRGLSSPSGGVFVSANDFAAWLRFHLRTSRGLDTPGLPPAERLRSMHENKILTDPSVRPIDERSQLRADFAHAYAYGWRTGGYRGVRVVYHAGSTPGYLAAAVLVPEANLAFGLLSNADSLSPQALALELLERVFGTGKGLWTSEFRSQLLQIESIARSPLEPVAIRQSDYVGTFHSTTSYGVLAIDAEGTDRLTARLGFMRMGLEAAGKDVFGARLRNDWDGPLGPVGPLVVQFGRKAGGIVVRTCLSAGHGIDNEREELEFTRD